MVSLFGFIEIYSLERVDIDKLDLRTKIIARCRVIKKRNPNSWTPIAISFGKALKSLS